jgi:hypothetical protein
MGAGGDMYHALEVVDLIVMKTAVCNCHKQPPCCVSGCMVVSWPHVHVGVVQLTECDVLLL